MVDPASGHDDCPIRAAVSGLAARVDFMDQELPVTVDDQRSGGLPETWSPSSLNTFLKCPLAYWWQYAQGWRSPPNAALEAGTLVHGVLEELLSAEPAARTRERAREIYALHAAELATTLDPRVDQDDLRARAGTALTSYFELETPEDVELVPDGLERRVMTTIDGVPIGGSIDRIEFSVGGVRVLDYKTGGAKPRYAEAYWRQLLLYAQMLENDGLDVSEIALLYLGEPARLMVRPVPPEARERAGRDLVDAAQTRADFDEQSRWMARTGPLCGSCPFRGVCPAWSRSAVPTPGSADSQRQLERSPDVVRRPPRVVHSAVADSTSGGEAAAQNAGESGAY